jgi:hypothetical protein
MPTYYYIITNKIVKALVNACNLQELDNYLINTILSGELGELGNKRNLIY